MRQSPFRFGATYRKRYACENSVVWCQGVREFYILEIIAAASLLGPLFAVVFCLADGPLKSIEPEVVIGSLICLGETWGLSVTEVQASSHQLTASKTEGQCCGLAREVDAHERNDELVEVDFAVVDKLRSPPAQKVY
jgi:hypothetical protein